jgi:hypothetical protein
MLEEFGEVQRQTMADEGGERGVEQGVKRRIAEAAQRARREAEERRRQSAQPAPPTREVNGRDGPEPVRYGDWEVKGIATDF